MEKRVFSVLLMGFSSYEQRVLNSTFLLSNHRSRSYRLLNSAADALPDMVMVDADAPQAVIEWQAYAGRNPAIPKVFVTNRPLNGSNYYIYRPITPNRALRILDQITINELKFAPELVVKDSGTAQELPIDDL